MKPSYRWFVIYLALLIVAFFSSIGDPSPFALFASDRGKPIAADVQAVTVYSNTVSFTATLAINPISSLNEQRVYHVATRLADGRVLLAGGINTIYDPMFRRKSTEIFDPATNQWSFSGDLNSGLSHATITLLDSGKALVVGGAEEPRDSLLFTELPIDDSAELYDPVLGTWSSAGTMHEARAGHAAILLADGRVLVAGGGTPSAEIYDPSDGSWTLTYSMQFTRTLPIATRLPNNQVLVAGGTDGDTRLLSAEIYDPSTGMWHSAAPMNEPHNGHTPLILPNGRVLVADGTHAEIYDPTLDEWTLAGISGSSHTQLLQNMPDGNVLLMSGDGKYQIYRPAAQSWSTVTNPALDAWGTSITPISTTEFVIAGGRKEEWRAEVRAAAYLATYIQANQFTDTLTLPSGWVNTNPIAVGVRGSTSAAPVEAASLRNARESWGAWIPITPDEVMTTTWNLGRDGTRQVDLRLRDSNGAVAYMASGMVMLDTVAPVSSMTAPFAGVINPGTVPPSIYSPATIRAVWTGRDATSKIAGYDLQVKKSGDADWTTILENTPNTHQQYMGMNGETYYFRVRARDHAGNVEAWPAEYDAITKVDAEAPVGFVDIATVGATSVLLLIDGDDNLSGLVEMRIGLAENFANTAWENFGTTKTISFGGPAPDDFLVYAQFRDLVGNISAIQCTAYGTVQCPDEPTEPNDPDDPNEPDERQQLALPMIRR